MLLGQHTVATRVTKTEQKKFDKVQMHSKLVFITDDAHCLQIQVCYENRTKRGIKVLYRV
jgi:hypothetical protein